MLDFTLMLDFTPMADFTLMSDFNQVMDLLCNLLGCSKSSQLLCHPASITPHLILNVMQL